MTAPAETDGRAAPADATERRARRPAPPTASPSPWTSAWMLIALGVLSAQVYLWSFTLRWPLWHLYDQPYLDYAFLSRYTREGQAAYLGSFLVLFVLQYLAYLLLRTAPAVGSPTLVLGGQLLFGVLLILIYPVAALDVYDYLMYGRVILVYGGNPFTQPPADFPDPLVGFSPWPREPSVYGPLWQIVSLVPTALSGGSLLAGLILFKLTALLFGLACSAAVWRLLMILAPAWAPAGTLLFAWNPLLLFELAGNGHNDAAMLLPVLLAVLALLRGPRLLVFPLLAAAVLTKLPAIALGPVFLFGLARSRASWRDRLTWIVGGSAISVVLTVALYAPFWEGTRTLHFLTRGNWFTASFPTLLREYFRRSLEYEEAGQLAASLVAGAFGLYVVGRLVALWLAERRNGTDPSDWGGWLRAAHDVTFVYLAFACIWWEPWYLTWLVGLAALVPSRPLHDRAILFCYGGVINYVVFKYVWPVYQPMTYTEIMAISVLAIFGLPLLHLACSLGALGGTRRDGRWRGSGAGRAASAPSP